MAKWEYCSINFGTDSLIMTKSGKQEIINIRGRDHMALLNELGAEDWELVTNCSQGSNTYQTLYFKRWQTK
jgi:hypothetical protein